MTFIDWYVRKEKMTFIDWYKLYIIHNAKKVEKKSWLFSCFLKLIEHFACFSRIYMHQNILKYNNIKNFPRSFWTLAFPSPTGIGLSKLEMWSPSIFQKLFVGKSNHALEIWTMEVILCSLSGECFPYTYWIRGLWVVW